MLELFQRMGAFLGQGPLGETTPCRITAEVDAA